MIWLFPSTGFATAIWLSYRWIVSKSTRESLVYGVLLCIMVTFNVYVLGYCVRSMVHKPFPAFISQKQFTSEYTRITEGPHSAKYETIPADYRLTLTSEDGKKSCTFTVTAAEFGMRVGTLLACENGEN